MLELGVKILLAYLLGTLLGSLISGAFAWGNVRSMGSGNAGATDTYAHKANSLHFWCSLDIAKGLFAV